MYQKMSTVLSVFVLIAASCFGQQNNVVYINTQKSKQSQENSNNIPVGREERVAINVGMLMGGGGLIGADIEFLAGKRIGLQFGGGLGSLGLGINYHFKPYINSQFVSIQYLQQGFEHNHYASYLGPMYVFRAKKIFQFGIGFGTVLSKGPGWKRAWENKENEPTGNVALLYNIGLYFPL